MNHPLQCRCGAVSGFVADPHNSNRAICYCGDCQAFAHFLGRAEEILDERGGSDVVQVLPKNITFTQGADQLACMRLSPKGLLRWYARCCNTPIGNTLATSRYAFISLLHTCLKVAGGPPLQESFGPVSAWVNAQTAKGDPKPKNAGLPAIALWFLKTVLKARINGDYRKTPFFAAATGKPVVEPRVIGLAERQTLMSAVRGS